MDKEADLWIEAVRLTHRYNHAADNFFPEMWANCFTPNGVFRGNILVQGYRQLIEFASGEESRMLRRGYRTRQHRTTNIVVTTSGTASLSVRSDLMMVMQPSNPRRPLRFRFASYRDELVRTDAGLLIGERRLQWWPEQEEVGLPRLKSALRAFAPSTGIAGIGRRNRRQADDHRGSLDSS